MVDPLSLLVGAAATFIAKPLIDAVGSHVAQASVTRLIDEIKVRRETVHLEYAHDLRTAIQQGSVKPGQFVEGTGFFSSYTVSHVPEVPLMWQMSALADSMLKMASTGDPKSMGNPYAVVLPTTRYPIAHDLYRVGFLYPHHMHGFGVPFMNDGTIQTLPWRGRQVCIVNAADVPSIENTIVRYRARVMTLGKSDMAAIFPEVEDDVVDNMIRSGLAYFLSAVEQGCKMDFYEPPKAQLIAGSHFLETHWETPAAVDDRRFVHVVDEAIKTATREVGYPQPQFFVEQVKHLNTWHAPTYNLIQPNGLPYFHFQMNAPLTDHPEQASIRTAFDSISKHITSAVDANYAETNEHRDLNSADDYRQVGHTVLQSTAARTITDPVLRAVRQWLEKKAAATETA